MRQSILLATHEFAPYPGGIGRYCTALANEAAAAGFEVDVIAPDHGAAAAPEMHQRCRLFRFAGGQFHLRDRAAYRRLVAERLAERRYAIVHAADAPAILALGALPTPGARRLATIYGTDVLMLRKSLRWRLAGAGRALASFERLACISSYTRGLLATHHPRLAARAEVVPLGVDGRWFQPPDAEAIAALRARFELRGDERLVLTVARIDRRKGQDLALRALAQLPAELRAGTRYLCIGREVEVDYGAELRQLAAGLGVRLTLTGQLPDAEVHAAYATSSVLAHTATSQPQRVEGFGLVLLEAAAAGLPAVVTPVDAIPEVVVAGRTGFVAEGAEGLAAAFRNVLDGERAIWSEACVAHARRYGWDACVRGSYGAA